MSDSDGHKTLRQYLTSEVGSTLVRETVEKAEELIDEYVKYIRRHISVDYVGAATSGTTTQLVDNSSDTVLDYADNYFKYCVVEFMSGNNAGEIRGITTNSKTGLSIDVNRAFDNAIASGDVYKIYQLGKFPRTRDVETLSDVYYKTIPNVVRRATEAQYNFLVEVGDEFLTGGADMVSESIDDYSYQLGSGNGNTDSLNRLISPEARALLKGIRNIKGRFA